MTAAVAARGGDGGEPTGGCVAGVDGWMGGRPPRVLPCVVGGETAPPATALRLLAAPHPPSHPFMHALRFKLPRCTLVLWGIMWSRIPLFSCCPLVGFHSTINHPHHCHPPSLPSTATPPLPSTATFTATARRSAGHPGRLRRFRGVARTRRRRRSSRRRRQGERRHSRGGSPTMPRRSS